MGTLDGKVAIVSGSGRGIGREIALKLASEGAKVVVNDLDADPAKETVTAVEAAGGRAVACVGNVTDADFDERFVQTAVEGFGGLDIIVNNAGYTWDSVIQKMTDEQWDAILDVHLKAPFRILRAAQPVIAAAVKKAKADGEPVGCRKVVNISSLAGTGGNAGQANYSSAKAGITGLTKAMAKEWGCYNVTVNTVAFGLIKTRLTESTAGGDGTTDVAYRSAWADDDVVALKEMATKFFQTEALSHRERWAVQKCVDRDFWYKAGELGLLCASVPEEYGGGGGTLAASNGSSADLIVLVVKTDPGAGRQGRVADRAGNRRRSRLPGRSRTRQGRDEGALVVAVWGAAVLQSAVEETVKYTKDRHAFGKPLFDLQNTRFELAECATIARIARVFVDDGIQRHLRGELDATTASMAKAWVSDMQVAVIDRCVQLFGDYGYMLEYPIARMFIDSRAQKIYAGANEVMKELIARSL
jgi:3-oxoacyl-[acyl-carrier protein] reductase